MAVDKLLYREADNLAHAKKSFYPVRIPISHWQLRHYISNPQPDLVYYASGHDVYCLNTASKKRRLIATLPFEARCACSGYGYVCVAGEERGHFAAIKLDGRSGDVDAARQTERGPQNGGRAATSIKLERMGEDIVNSVSIHRIQDEEVHLDDIVAVLTNNDKTVRMYSLPSNLETRVLDLPFPMNHASLSPDGHMLVAVGDVNQAFFFQREILDTPPQIHKPHNRLTSSSVHWKLVSVINLHAAPRSSMGYFTTTWSPSGHLVAVGSEGGYITVIDVDILTDSLLTDDKDAVVAVIPGSRPDGETPHPGAIRSMLFSPEPWDLLVWAEDQGRVCIGDLRTGLKSRQVIHLDPKDESVERIALEDISGADALSLTVPRRSVDELEAEYLRRHRQLPSDMTSSVNFATEYIEARRRQRQVQAAQDVHRSQSSGSSGIARERSTPIDSLPQGLGAREQQVLESLRISRQREEARSQGGVARSISYTTPEMFIAESTSNSRSTTRSNALPSNTVHNDIREMFDSTRDSFPELSRTSATATTSVRPTSSHGTENRSHNTLPSLRDMGGWTERPSEDYRVPRRRASIVLDPARSLEATAPLRLAQRVAATEDEENDDDDEEEEEEDENPWRTIEEHMSLARGPLFESAARAQPALPLPAPEQAPQQRPSDAEFTSELQAERARARSLARQRERARMVNVAAERGAVDSRLPTFSAGQEILLRRAQLRAFSPRDLVGSMGGIKTAGLAISADGRTLWAACEEGIFEIGLCLKGRLFWPAVEVR